MSLEDGFDTVEDRVAQALKSLHWAQQNVVASRERLTADVTAELRAQQAVDYWRGVAATVQAASSSP